MKIIITATDMTKLDGKLKSIRREIPAIAEKILKQITLAAWRKMARVNGVNSDSDGGDDI